MKKICFILAVLFTCSFPVFAENNDADANNYIAQIEHIAEENNINSEQINDFDINSIVTYLKNEIFKNISEPLKIFYKISAILILAAMLNLFESNQSKNITTIVNSLCLLVIFLNLLTPFKNMIYIVSQNLIDLKNFMATFLPIFASISIASGQIVSSTIYTGLFLMGIVFISDICVKFILPTINLFLAVNVTSSVSQSFDLKSLCEFYTKFIKIFMTIIVSVLCFVLTIQSTIAQGQDNLAVKTGKFLISSTVPIIGSALQGAVGSVYASMQVVKGFAGIVGVVSIAQMFIPTLIVLSVNWLCLSAGIVVSDVLDNKQSSGVLKGFQNVIEILFSIVFLFSVLLIFSITIIIKSTQGV